MLIQTTNIKDILILTPKIFTDYRGSFCESFNSRVFNQILNQYNNCMQNINFVQDNHSISHKNVLRGLHYQINHAQGKLIRVIRGKALDVAVDIRKSSATFGQYHAIELSQDNYRQVWIPAGFAHGFLALSSKVECIYKITDYYYSEFERSIIWNDKILNINWNIANPILSYKDKIAASFNKAELYD